MQDKGKGKGRRRERERERVTGGTGEVGRRERGRNCLLGRGKERKELRLEAERNLLASLEGWEGQGLSLKGIGQIITVSVTVRAV